MNMILRCILGLVFCLCVQAQELPEEVTGPLAGIEADLKNTQRYLEKGDASYVKYYLESAKKYWDRIESGAPESLDHPDVLRILGQMNELRKQAGFEPIPMPGGASPAPGPLPSGAQDSVMWLGKALDNAERGASKNQDVTAYFDEALGFFQEIVGKDPNLFRHPDVVTLWGRYAGLCEKAARDPSALSAKQQSSLDRADEQLRSAAQSIAAGDRSAAAGRVQAAEGFMAEVETGLLPPQAERAQVVALRKELQTVKTSLASSSAGGADGPDAPPREARPTGEGKKEPPADEPLPSLIKDSVMWLERALDDAQTDIDRGGSDAAGYLRTAKEYFIAIKVQAPEAVRHPQVQALHERYRALCEKAGYDIVALSGKQCLVPDRIDSHLKAYQDCLERKDFDEGKRYYDKAEKEMKDLEATLLDEQAQDPALLEARAALEKATQALAGEASQQAERSQRAPQEAKNLISYAERLVALKEEIDRSRLGYHWGIEEPFPGEKIDALRALFSRYRTLLGEAEVALRRFDNDYPEFGHFESIVGKDLGRPAWEAKTRVESSLTFASEPIDWAAESIKEAEVRLHGPIMQGSKNLDSMLDMAAKKGSYADTVNNVAILQSVGSLCEVYLDGREDTRSTELLAKVRGMVNEALEMQVELAKTFGEVLDKENIRLASARFPSKGMEEQEFRDLEKQIMGISGNWTKKMLRVRIVSPWEEKHGWFQYGERQEWEDFRFVWANVALQNPDDPRICRIYEMSFRQMISADGSHGPIGHWGIAGSFEMLTENVNE
ncbi:MAG: hypothetical protein HY720_13500 [Planctomycetes bacterium]|nr:hypothetical protein [Planctomycetota bacterium]